ncbi:hypothetical protein [Tropicibacter naphthalenivorans]|uniref:Uncharacterized protein n=1 Tax=Tropicibacter naphthalenivorans TaxID=441103 RepID=A0A0P1GRL4_9RHOB|nr:hypothetical protein [Tropicibacter naphthalenivorans]CUH77221.1 hypothetical protein TRN7648_01356 [Tropicibacter naphthalenivorans]SMC59820.1 hypothetical protein SAMN04488093_102262 [Tropicibacter naphthalenivorans]
MTEHDKKTLTSFVDLSDRLMPWVAAAGLGLLVVITVSRLV